MKPAILLAVGLLLTGTSGYLASVALSQGSQEPTRTVTINVATGERGPAGPTGAAGPPGPPGPAGPPGDPTNCGPGYQWSVVIFNAPGGQETIKACLKN